jgi:hypothetical protein
METEEEFDKIQSVIDSYENDLRALSEWIVSTVSSRSRMATEEKILGEVKAKLEELLLWRG